MRGHENCATIPTRGHATTGNWAQASSPIGTRPRVDEVRRAIGLLKDLGPHGDVVLLEFIRCDDGVTDPPTYWIFSNRRFSQRPDSHTNTFFDWLEVADAIIPREDLHKVADHPDGDSVTFLTYSAAAEALEEAGGALI